jgi:hypothetical protein
MNKLLPLIIILSLFNLRSYSQFMVDTLDVVEIKDSKKIKKPNFSTFTTSVSLNNSSFGLSKSYQDSSVREFILPNAIQVQNTKGIRVRLDSMLIKCSIIDTSKLIFSLNIFAANKLFSSSQVRFSNRQGKVNTVLFDNDVYLPAETAYIGFSYIAKDNYHLSLYTNKKVPGYLYSYNKERDEFKLIKFDHDVPPLTCPQIKLYYTKMD